jgi:prepilin-type processing-associated H-X9-DG protein
MKYENTGVFFYHFMLKASDVTDGTSHTLFAGEVLASDTLPSLNFWHRASRELCTLRSTSNPLNTPPGEGWTFVSSGQKINGAFGSRHAGGANFVFGDGRVQFIEENIALGVYKAMSTRDGGEVLENDQ